MDTLNDKAQLRREAVQQRRAFPLAAQQAASLAAMENFLSQVQLPQNSIVSGYWPLSGEMNVMPWLVALLARGHACALPQVHGRSDALTFLAWREDTPMRKGVFAKLAEPDPAHAASVKPNVVIVPMLAFDSQGNRLGYGAGHYDRTFAVLGEGILKVGAAFEHQYRAALPADAHDVKLDLVVTEAKIHRFKGQE